MWRLSLKARHSSFIALLLSAVLSTVHPPTANGMTAENALGIISVLREDLTSSTIAYKRYDRSEALYAIVGPLISRVKYRWGGTKPETGLDCSAFVQWVHKHLGKTIPRTSKQQAKSGRYIPPNQVDTGDVVFFSTNANRWSEIDHCGIMIDNGCFVHCTSGKGVIITKVDQYQYPVLFGRRY